MKKLTILILVVTMGSGCALFKSLMPDNTIGKAVQVQAAQKSLVVEASKEVIRMHNAGKIDDAKYAVAKDRYEVWRTAENNMAEAEAQWKAASTTNSEARLSAAIAALKPISEDLIKYFESIGVDMAKVQKAVEK
jgi:hypothetical protein